MAHARLDRGAAIRDRSAEPPGGPWVAFDLETTGLSAELDRIIEVGAVRFDGSGRELDRFERLICPGRPIGAGARAVHGLSDADVADAPPAAVVLADFLGWIDRGGAVALLAHNARFDAGFLGRELARAGLPRPPLPVLDTLDLARRRLPNAPRGHRLDALAAWLGLADGAHHRALADSRRVMGLWLSLHGEPGTTAAYPIFDPIETEAPPSGFEPLVEAIARGWVVRLSYGGGTQGPAPRDVTPRRIVHRGGITYVLAVCHKAGFEKAFRLDRVLSFEVIGGPGAARDA